MPFTERAYQAWPRMGLCLATVLGAYMGFLFFSLLSRTFEYSFVAVMAFLCMVLAQRRDIWVCRTRNANGAIVLLVVFLLSAVLSAFTSPFLLKSLARTAFLLVIVLFFIVYVSRREVFVNFAKPFLQFFVLVFFLKLSWLLLAGESARIIGSGVALRLSLGLNSNALGMMLFVALLLGVSLPRFSWKLPLVAFILLLIVLTGSRASLFAALTALLVYAGLVISRLEMGERRKYLVLALLLFLVVAVTYGLLDSRFHLNDALGRLGSMSSVYGRVSIWQFMVEVIRRNWLSGVGYGVHGAILKNASLAGIHMAPPSHGNAPYSHAHNQFLALFAEIGVIGFMAYVLLLARGLAVFWRAAREGGKDAGIHAAAFAFLIGYVVLGMVETFHMHSGSLVWIIHWVFLARSLYMPADSPPLCPCGARS